MLGTCSALSKILTDSGIWMTSVVEKNRLMIPSEYTKMHHFAGAILYTLSSLSA